MVVGGERTRPGRFGSSRRLPLPEGPSTTREGMWLVRTSSTPSALVDDVADERGAADADAVTSVGPGKVWYRHCDVARVPRERRPVRHRADRLGRRRDAPRCAEGRARPRLRDSSRAHPRQGRLRDSGHGRARRRPGPPDEGGTRRYGAGHPAQVPPRHPRRAAPQPAREEPPRARGRFRARRVPPPRSRSPTSSAPSTGRSPTCTTRASAHSRTQGPRRHCPRCGWRCGRACGACWRRSRSPTSPVRAFPTPSPTSPTSTGSPPVNPPNAPAPDPRTQPASMTPIRRRAAITASAACSASSRPVSTCTSGCSGTS